MSLTSWVLPEKTCFRKASVPGSWSRASRRCSSLTNLCASAWAEKPAEPGTWFTVVVVSDTTVPRLSLDSVRLLEGGNMAPCGPIGSTAAFVVFQFPASACGTTMKEEGGYVVYENQLSSSYEVEIGDLGSITRDSIHELVRLEQRLDAQDQLPGTDAFLKQSSSGSTQLVRDMWQLMQLRKKTEANQDGITKAMSVLGDILDEVRILKDTRDSTLSQMEALQRSLSSDLAAIPHPEELVLWSHVAEALPQLSRPQDQPSTESAQQVGQRALQMVGGLSAEQGTLKDELGSQQDQLRQLMLSLVNKDIPDNMQARLKSLDDEVHALKNKDKQEQRGLASLWDKFSAEFDRQNAANQQLLDNYREVELKWGMRSEDALLNQAQQEAISQHLSSILQDLLPALPTQDRDWPGMLEKLSKDMECKLDRVELTPLRQELEEGWRRVKAQLKEEPDFNADTPAGFRKLPRAHGGVQARRTAASRRPPSAQALHTLYPSTDPALQPYCRTVGSTNSLSHEEVGILGTDGILYRGRVELTLPSLVPPCSRSSAPILTERM
ncbi:hypothetical protein AAFF_G00081380 [Aldrovandia affinis]|uniref:Uncharacterized protein n=1 Tax=Aldrovandia affinis TaxID=143900 RepID=A0AAD7T549_9TELE|nr:hypothetical protein AAFF_G00081380 [Aldrovandia affinis]